METDPIIIEVRAAGKIISDKCDNDVHKFADFIRENEKKNQADGWKYVSEVREKVLK